MPPTELGVRLWGVRLLNGLSNPLFAFHTLKALAHGAHAFGADMPSAAVAAKVCLAIGVPVARWCRRLRHGGATHRFILACLPAEQYPVGPTCSVVP